MLSNLNPENLLIDDRKIDDLIIYVSKLSNLIQFYDNKNKLSGNWSEFFSDETFLLSEISKFDIEKYDILRLNLIKEFDEFSSENEKKEIVIQFYNIIYVYLQNIDIWYKKALKNNLTIKSSYIEYELEQAIINKLNNSFKTFSSYRESLNEITELEFRFSDFNLIWSFNKNSHKSIFEDIDQSQSKFSSALKKLILLYKPIHLVLQSLRIKAKSFFQISLNNNDNHNPHIGLLFSFFELFKHYQKEINSFSTRHLDFYYKNILKQSPKQNIPNKVYINIDIDENMESLGIDIDRSLIAGQEIDGKDIIYNTNHEIILNNSKVEEISSMYVSRNKKFDFESSFRIVSGIYSKKLANSFSDVNEFNSNNETFLSLGEDQIFKSIDDKTMETARLGFAVSSPTLISEDSERTIIFDLFFTQDSIQYLSNLIINISNHNKKPEEQVFSDIFYNSFIISYTSDFGWFSDFDYSVEYPEDWTKGIISIKIIISKNQPPINRYIEEIHKQNIKTDFPVFEFRLNNQNFYYPYSFFDGIEISKIDINAKIKNLKNIKIFSEDEGALTSSDIELFGTNPKKGSKLFIGSTEIFCKKIENLVIDWNYTNFPNDFDNLKEYYDSYNRDILDQSFEINISALIDYKYLSNSENNLNFKIFELEKNKTSSKISIEIDDIGKLKLKPSYHLVNEDIENYSKDLETGFLKIELINPNCGFGFDIYPIVLKESIEKNAKSKKNELDDLNFPNEPFIPIISDLSISYSSKSSLVFNNSGDQIDNDSFFLIHPIEGYKKIESNNMSFCPIVPNMDSQGELYLGISKVKNSQEINLFFEIEKNTSSSYNFSSKLEWFYSSNNGWKKFENSSILYDETYHLTKTGVISFRLNTDCSNLSINNNNLFYLKACSKNQVDQFSLIKRLLTNSVLCTQKISSGSSNNTLLPNSIQDFEKPLTGIIKINQPLPSFGGVKKENDQHFYRRVSELLSHKNRPSTKKDIENFLLTKFEWLGFVKCYKVHENDLKINLLCLKKITHNQNIDEIRLSDADGQEILNYIKEFISPFTNIIIINPIFEEFWIKAKVKFKELPSGKGIAKLNKDLLNFFCPWLLSESFDNINIGGSIKKSEIINFIKARKYIKFVTGISLIHIKTNKNGETEIYDSASDSLNLNHLKSGTPFSIIIPRNYSQIQILDEEKYYPPTKTSFEELTIERNFIITSEKSNFKTQPIIKGKEDKTNFPSTFNFKFS